MPVQPVISMDQIVIIVAFLMMLFLLMWFVKRNRGGIAGRLNPARRMQHIEDMSLAPQQRLHLIEVDGRTFLVHAGKGHAATFMPVDGTSQGVDQLPPATRRKGEKCRGEVRQGSTRKAEKRLCRRGRASTSQQPVAEARQMTQYSVTGRLGRRSPRSWR